MWVCLVAMVELLIESASEARWVRPLLRLGRNLMPMVEAGGWMNVSWADWGLLFVFVCVLVGNRCSCCGCYLVVKWLAVLFTSTE